MPRLNNIQLRRGTYAEWDVQSTGILSVGEPGFVTDFHQLKIGDGVTQWSDLVAVNDALTTVVFNNTGSEIPKMSVVYINGAQGDLPTIALALANGEGSSAKTYGITATAIANGAVGYVVVDGALKNLSTSPAFDGVPLGTNLWLSPTVSGGITTTKPYAPNHIVGLGNLIRVHNQQGIIEVKIQNGFELEELHNVAATGVTNNQYLIYNSGTGLWGPTSSGIFNNVYASGNVGIGTVAPSGTLHVVGTGIISSKLGVGTNNPTYDLDVRTNSTNAFYVTQGGGARYLSLDGNGFINNTTLAVSKTSWNNLGSLELSTSIASRRGVVVQQVASQTANAIETRDNSNNVLSYIGADGGSYFAGNVGIGTTTPSTKLHVNGSALIGKTFFSDTVYSFGNGILIATDIATTDNFMCNLTIEGNSYDTSKGPIFSRVQFYNYVTNGNIISTSAISTDKDFTIDVFHYNGYVYLWFAQTASFQSYTFKINTMNSGKTITAITNAIKPTSGVTNSVTITPYKIWNAANDGASSGLDADLLDGNHASAFQLASTALTTSTNFGGDVSGTYNNIVVADDSHNHIIDNVDGLQSELNLKAPLASPTFTGTPAAPTAASGTNTTQIATTAFVRTEISNLVDAAPGTLDTLNELAAALGDDPNFATTVTNSIATKANTNQTMYIGTTAVAINRTSASLSLTGVSIDGNAGTATSTTTLTSNGNLTTQNGNGTVGYAYQIVNGTTGLFSSSNNSNSILTLNRHSGNYYSQLGFSSNGNLYYRAFTDVAIDTTTPWQTIWTSSSLTNLNQLTNGPGYTTNTGTVTSVGGTGTVAGLTLTGTVTTTGSLTLGGTLSTPISSINDSTTVGQNLVKLTNPSAVRFLRINANNTVDALTDSQFRTAIGAGTSSTTGTVTSVGLSLPDIFNVSNSPISSSGTLSAGFVTQASNTVFAGPSSGNGTPSFRALVAADIPTLNQNTTGSAATLTTSRTLWGQSFNGSANVTGNMSSVGKVEQSWGDQRIGIFFNNDYRSGMAVFGNSRLTTIFSTTNDGTGGAITFNTRVGAGSSDTDYGTERMRITNTGDVGIGTTTPATKLDVRHTGGSTDYELLRIGNNSNASDVGMRIGFWDDASGTFWSKSTGAITVRRVGSGSTGAMLFTTRDSQTTESAKMVITGGNVGIATTSPSHRLQLGTTTSTSTATPETISLGGTFSSSAGGNAKLRLWTDGSNVIGLGVSSNQLDYICSAAYSHVFYNNGSESWRITSAGVFQSNGAKTIQTSTGNLTLATAAGNGHILLSPHGTGNVGIGTASPAVRFHVEQNTTSYAELRVANTSTSARLNLGCGGSAAGADVANTAYLTCTTSDRFLLRNDNTNGYIDFATGGVSSSNIRMRLDNTGNLGIGTSTPSEILHLSKNDATIKIADKTSNAGVGPRVLLASNYGGTEYTASLGFSFYANDTYLQHGRSNIGGIALRSTNGTTRLYVQDSSGNVGIGVTDPDEKLEVNGNIHLAADGTLYFGVAGTNTRLIDDSGSNRTVLRARGDTFDIINAAGNAFSATLRTGIISGGSTATNNLVLKSTSGVGTTDYISLAVGNNGATEAVRVINNGNVGIGTTTPSQKLDVVGIGKFGEAADVVYVGNDNIGGEIGISTASDYIAAYTTADNKFRYGGNGSTTIGIVINSSQNVGIGTESPSYKLQVNGSFGATTKSFRIDHPSRPNYTLEYGSLESPYHGVRLTGRGRVVKGSGVVSLPDYLKDLIHDDETINIQITNIKHGKTIYVDEIDLNNDRFTVKADKCKTLGDLEFFWTFTGTRKDVDKLVVEAEK